MDEGGVSRTTKEDIFKCNTDYYSNLFYSISPLWEVIDQALRFIEHKVDDDMNRFLDRDFTKEELKQTTFDLSPSKVQH